MDLLFPRDVFIVNTKNRVVRHFQRNTAKLKSRYSVEICCKKAGSSRAKTPGWSRLFRNPAKGSILSKERKEINSPRPRFGAARSNAIGGYSSAGNQGGAVEEGHSFFCNLIGATFAIFRKKKRTSAIIKS